MSNSCRAVYRRVLLAQRTVFSDDADAIARMREWTRSKFVSSSDLAALSAEMDGLCVFLKRGLAQLEHTGSRGRWRLKWREGLEINDNVNSPVKSPCKCC